jgi:hypothetical protein
MAISPLIASQDHSLMITVGPAFDEIRANMMEIIWQMMEDGMHIDIMKKGMIFICKDQIMTITVTLIPLSLPHFSEFSYVGHVGIAKRYIYNYAMDHV